MISTCQLLFGSTEIRKFLRKVRELDPRLKCHVFTESSSFTIMLVLEHWVEEITSRLILREGCFRLS